MTRGVMRGLTCPRCHTSRTPTGDRRPVTCARCALTFTIEAGERATDRAPGEPPTAALVAPSRTGVRFEQRGGALVVRLPPTRVELALMLGVLGVLALTLAASETIAAGWILGPLLVLAVASWWLPPSRLTLDARGLRTRTARFALDDLVHIEAAGSTLLIAPRTGSTYTLPTASPAAADEIATALVAQLARLRR
ncbi:MAG: hypothetical protein NT062_30965 [Proteobacteria bacterium]|nr:hypothetical protein [Pseudomonadota bacterium]